MRLLSLNNRKGFILITAAAILSEALYIFFAGTNGTGDTGLYMFIYFEVFIVFLFAFYLIKNSDPEGGITLPFLNRIFTKTNSESAKFNIPVLIILF